MYHLQKLMWGGLSMKKSKVFMIILVLLILSSIQVLANLEELNTKIEKLEKQISLALILKKVDLSEDDAAYLFTVSINSIRKIENLKNEEILVLENIKKELYNDNFSEIERLSKEFYTIELKILEEQMKLLKEFEAIVDKEKTEKLKKFLEEKNLDRYLKEIPFESIVENFKKLLELIPEDLKEKTAKVIESVEKLHDSIKAHILFSLITDEDFIEALKIVGKVNLESNATE